MGRGLAITLGAVLFLSLAFNVFAFGFFSGRMLAGFNGPPPRPAIEERAPRLAFEDPFRIMRYAEELSPELRDEFRASFREQLPQMREAHGEMRKLREELSVLMTADEWDDAAIDAKLGEIRAVENGQQAAFTEAFVEVFKSLPAAERKALIEEAKARHKERRKRWKEQHGDRGPGRDGPPPGGPDGPGGDMPPPPPDDE
jgi:uncharacterized membrane protein